MPADNSIIAPRVLVVDRSAESRDVLCTLLARGGSIPIAAESVATARHLARQQAFDLIVVDSDTENSPEAFAQIEGHKVAPVVLLGKVSRRGRRAAGTTLAKPYHYRDLLHKIGEVLASHRSA